MTTPVLSAQRPTISRRWLPWLAAGGYILALTLAFPPFKQGWAVLIFLTPFVKWAFAEPRWRTYLAAALGAGWGSWFCILIWLRHIYPPYGWLGLALLSGYLGLYALAWLAALRWAAPRLKGASRGRRVMGMLALAGWWIVLDWVRGTLFTGFPWLPLAAAFWEFPLLLQLAAWTGQSGVTFMIVLFNLGLVCGTGAEPRAGIAPPPRRKIWWPARCGPEMLLPLALFFGAVLLSLQLLSSHRRAEVRLLRAGIVQPATPALLKWDPAAADKNRDTLLALTQTFTYRDGSRNNVDLVLWPEAALPVLFQGAGAGPNREALGQIVNKLGVPLLLGGIGEAYPRPGQPETPGQFDGVFLVRPGAGFATEVYAKRHLVPFGEYNPVRNWLPFLGKVVPIDADTVPGDRAVTIPLPLLNGHTVHLGPLVCYEDIFANLAREETRAGADFLVVVTNDAWYGTGGGALQHAAHSVLRAIETRRPIVRCGNDGWSGFIDQDGDAFPLEKNGRVIESGWILTKRGTTYFQGAGALYLYSNPQFDGAETFYVRFGDWFVALSALLAAAGAVLLAKAGLGKG
jgi:apolipoprotein N-acyltransferase